MVSNEFLMKIEEYKLIIFETFSSSIGTVWTMDFSNETEQYSYTRDTSELSYSQTMFDGDISLLNNVGISSLRELAEIDKDNVLELKTGNAEPDFMLGHESWRNGPIMTRYCEFVSGHCCNLFD